MNRKNSIKVLSIVFLSLAISFLAACSGSSASTPSTPASSSTPTPAKLTATGGALQSEAVGSAFSAMQVTVTSSNSTPVSGVTVTFTAPSTGASCTFQNGATMTATTNTSGIATSGVCTANTTPGAYSVMASVTGVSPQASFSLTNTSGAAATITASSGSGQNASIDRVFAAPLVAKVVDSDSNPVSGVTVTFTAPSSGASGAFQNTGSATETDITNASGIATSSTFTANGTTGAYTVTATANSLSPASFSLSNNVTYVFYLRGVELANSNNQNETGYYTIAGAVSLDSSGDVLGGEQDYNDGNGITSPGEPTPDTINPLSSALVVNSTTGQGTLTLSTSNPNVGVNGTETLGVQFVNASHALIVQFDSSATSSGSLDVQTATNPANQGFAFAIAGTDSSFNAEATGGVFTVSGASVTNGVADVNDNGTVSPGNTFTSTLSGTDTLGRGTFAITGSNTITYSYYVIGPEAMRVMDIDTTDTGVGSAYGQGTATTFTNTSLGNSVFGLIGLWPHGVPYTAAGQFTVSSGATFQGVADVNVGGLTNDDAAIAGSYSISNTISSVTYNGYGSLTINAGSLGDVSALGMYMTDPNLNLQDPNNPSGGGGALVLDMDSFLAGGVGIVLPQTDTSTADFANNYALGSQDFNGDIEADFIAQGPVTSLAFSGVGLLNGDLNFFGSTGDFTDAVFSGLAVADTNNAGRYTVPLTISPTGTPMGFSAVVYQASGAQLLWMTEDNYDAALGSFQQQGSLTAVPAMIKPEAKVQGKR